ncbi:hypothetical protein GCM10022280_06800 [Sphingomonas swuensis]|uniref:TonB C-terminal domain-containing protein n=1 Tax=Sphingomonas swuensis TaxID=977800 RepID=A0ABP7SHU9_9SPHN
MQRSWVSNRDRAVSIAAVLLVHAVVLAGLLTLGGGPAKVLADLDPLQVFDVPVEPPPMPPPPPPAVEQKAPEEEGAAAPPARKAQATPIQRPEPRVELPVAPPVVAAETPGTGAAPAPGAAPVDGPGTGAGGQGNGTGSGSGGTGTGGGGSGGKASGPSVIAGTTLRGRDYPRAVLRAWPSRARVFVAIRVQVDGRATNCRVDRSSGNAVIDQWTCRLVEERVRFRPATDDDGRPVVSWYGYVQSPVNF